MTEAEKRNNLKWPGETIAVDAPGLKCVSRKGGSHYDYYWAVDEAEGFKGYPVRTVRIHVKGLGRDAAMDLIIGTCLREQQAMLAWLDGAISDDERLAARFDGRVKSLVELYRSDPESSFQALKANSQESYEEWLQIVEDTIGLRLLSHIKPKFFRTCFLNWSSPVEAGSPERLRRAYGAIQMVKASLNYGIEADIPHARRLRDGLERMRFSKNPPREKTMEYVQASAIVDTCLKEGAWRMALAQAVQWDTMLRQKDVIGEYRKEPASYALKPNERRYGSRVWRGLVLSQIDIGRKLVVRTTKTAQPVMHVIDECELIMRVLPHVNRSDPSAPVALTSRGVPWGDHRSFSKAWRVFADKAGVPDDVWNMDARASAVTEAMAGGASDDDIAANAGHANVLTTRRVYKRTRPEVSQRVQEKRRKARQSSPN